MSRLPTVSPGLLIKFLKEMGFKKSRQHGSHIFGMLTAGRRRFLSTKAKIWAVG